MANESPPIQSDSAGEGEGLAAKRYALAALELAEQNKDANAWLKAVRQIADFMGDPEIRRVLENTRVSQEPKQRLIEAALGDLPPLPLNLARLLVRKDRAGLANEIAFQFERLVERKQGISRARAITAVPLGDAEREALTRRIAEQTGGEVLLETEVDPEVLGGVVVQIGDQLIDASTRTKLQALRDSLSRAV